MKKLLCLFTMLLIGVAMADLDVAVKGAEPGAWTMDMDAALVKAKELKMPVLLLFTGSDWCAWCKKLEANVLTKDAWKAFAKENLMLVYLDFPQNKSKVPEQFKARNDRVRDMYEIEGYPTLILLDENEKKLDELHYDESVEKFIFQVKQPLRFHPKFFGKLTAGMPEQELNTLKKERQTIEDNARRVKELSAQIEVLSKEKDRLEEKTDRDMDNWIIKSRLPQKQEEFKAASQQYAATLEELKNWLKTEPEENDENTKKYKQFGETLKKQEAEIVKLLSEALNTEK